MAKDPAFLFYPADASEDTQFMNRLERGAYFDILKAQKRFGRFTLEQIKKVLGGDFEAVWPSILMCLSCVDDMYFIPWVDDSISKRREYSESRRNNRKGGKKGENSDILPTHDDGSKKTSSTYDEHMGNEIGNANRNGSTEGGTGETASPPPPGQNDYGKKFIVVELAGVWKKCRPDYVIDPAEENHEFRAIADKIAQAAQVTYDNIEGIDRIKGLFERLVLFSNTHAHYKDYQVSQFRKYFNNIASACKSQSVAGNGQIKSVVQSNFDAAQQALEILRKKRAAEGAQS